MAYAINIGVIMVVWLRNITHRRFAWGLLGLSAVFLEACALLFQHGLGLRPCLMCVYERLVVIAIIISAMVAVIDPSKLFFRWSGLIAWGFCIYRGLQLSLMHVDYLLHPSPFNTCSLVPDFPTWMPLDTWLPWWFKPLSECSEKQWVLMGWELPQWLVLIFSLYFIVWLIIIAANLLTNRYLTD
jgi:disulfide bond formation protein DsbB|nr:disulfide bond formation protein DsbB [uncultured Tolumonas sp.]